MQKPVIIFDCDGVLMSCNRFFLLEAYRAIFNLMGKPCPDFMKGIDVFMKWWTPNWRENQRRIGLPEELEEGSNRIFYRAARRYVFLLPWTNIILGRLSKKYRLAVATNRHRTSAVVNLEPVIHHFDLVVGAEDVVNLKPHPEMIELVLKKLGVGEKEKATAIFVGDMLEDVVAGKAAGIRTAAVIWKYGLGRDEDFRIVQPDLILRTPQSFLKLNQIKP